jgi:hypothetical protein
MPGWKQPSDVCSEHALSEIKLPWRAARKVRRARRQGRTGLVAHAIIRTPSRSMSSLKGSVSIYEGDRKLCHVSTHSRRPKWVELRPGSHVLTFDAVRDKGFSRMEKEFTLAPGDVLVALAWPIQPWTIFGASPSTDRWYLGVV